MKPQLSSKAVIHLFPVRRLAVWLLISSLSVFCLSVSIVNAADKDRVSQDLPESMKKELTEDLKSELKKIYKTSQELRQLHQAQKAGLSTIVKRISPEGGRFEILPDGVIRIIPKDKSIINKLIKNEQQNKETVTETEIVKAATKGPASSITVEPSDTSKKQGETQQKISAKTMEIIKRLQEANKHGLSDMLKKLATDGGKFELIENGGIRIIPNKTEKTKALAKTSEKVNKIAKQKKLNSMTKTLQSMHARIDSWTKVRNTAKAWIKEKNKTGLSVGKIRHIKWLYIVSIVNKKGKMDTQLVVRKSDGKTIAFTQTDFEVFN